MVSSDQENLRVSLGLSLLRTKLVEEWALGVPGVGGASAWSVPRSRGRSSARGCLGVEGTKCGEGFFGRNPSAPAPMTSTPAGVVILLGALLWLPSPH
jgi:hypothetical protein